MNIKDKKYVNAYLTVEASLLLPMVMLFITIMIFLAFFSYDRCIMEQSAYEAALSGTGNHIKEAEIAADKAQTAAGGLIEGKLFAISNVTYKAEAGENEVTVTYSGEINMPFVEWIKEFIGDTNFSINVTKTAKRCCQTRIIRSCRVINKN